MNHRPAPTRLNPVRLPSGQPHQFTPEFHIPGTLPVNITRAYNPAFDGPSPLGPGYLSDLDLTITDGEAPDTYDVMTLDGIAVDFARPDPQLFARSYNDGFRHLSLEPLPRGGLQLNDRKLAYRFKRYTGRIWRIVQIKDLNGNAITLDRDAAGLLTHLRHPDGVTLEFHNQTNGLRGGFDVIGLDGSRVDGPRYGYDDQGRLAQVTTPFGEDWTYGYDAAGNRTLADNGAGTRTLHRYDAENRVIEVDTGGSYKHGRISYHPAGRQVTVHHGTDDAAFEKLWFDDQGRHFMTSDAAGRFSYRSFNDQHDLVSETDENGHVTRHVSDATGNPQSVIDPMGRETLMVWDDQSNLMSVVDHAGGAWDYEYDDKGNLEQSRNPLGHITNFRTTPAGLPSQMMRHDGLIEFRNYDDHNRLTGLVDFNSSETTFTYDTFNRVTVITDPGGHETRLDYTPQKGCDFLTPTSITRPDGVQVQRDFGTTGRVEAVTDGEGRTTRYAYGPYNVLEVITDPRGHDLRFQYDSQERLVQVTNQMGLHWTFTRDTAGRVTQETDFDGRSLVYTYDPAGRVIRRDNPDGGYLEYDYDASGLLLEMRAFAQAKAKPFTTTYGYDDNGALIAAQNPDATIALTRDALGRITSETVNGTTLTNELDCCGLRSARQIGDQRVEYTYDGMGGLTQWALAGHAPLALTRDALGREVARDNGRGFGLHQSWDAVGQLTGQEAGQVVGRSYAWSKAFEPVVIADLHNGTRTYDYDANGQIARTTHGDGGVETFTYTPDLNLSGSGDTDKFVNWQTTAAGVVKLARGPMGEVVTLEHDANGRVIKRSVTRDGFRPQTWTFDWNAMDQMVRAHCPNGDTWSYKYDPFGRRISKSCAHTRVTFLWDGDVIAREVTMGGGVRDTVDWFFEPGSFRPMARLSHGHLSYVVNDHLGTPKEVVSSDGHLEWTAELTTWGAVRRKVVPAADTDFWTSAKAPLEDDDTPAPLTCPIRFQGQWEDAETGLYQNRFRYYDALVGHFSARDPLGPVGGPRPFGYVVSPSLQIDPNGLVGVYLFETLDGNCYVGKGDEGRMGQSQDFRTGSPRGDGAGCCRSSMFTDLEDLAASLGVDSNDFAKMVENQIMNAVGATAPDSHWLNRNLTGQSAWARNPSAQSAATQEANRVLSEFRTNSSGTIC